MNTRTFAIKVSRYRLRRKVSEFLIDIPLKKDTTRRILRFGIDISKYRWIYPHEEALYANADHAIVSTRVCERQSCERWQKF